MRSLRKCELSILIFATLLDAARLLFFVYLLKCIEISRKKNSKFCIYFDRNMKFRSR